MANPIKFGTDGWRAIIAEDYTFANVRACAQGVADYLREAGLADRGLIIGYDTRFASEDFAAATAEVVAANGIHVCLCPKATPTPVISYGVLAHKCGGGVIITASHNPGNYNGFKYKTELGSSAPDETTAKIEKYTNRAVAAKKIERLPLDEAIKQKTVEYIDLDAVYFNQINKLIDVEPIKQAGLKVVVDSMYGAGSGYLKKLLSGGKTEIVEIDCERNPLFPGFSRPEPIAANLAQLSKAVIRRKAGIGLATDGDADRMGIMDENGVFLTQLQVFALLCLYLLEVRGEHGAIVKTITTTSMTYRLGELFKVPVYEEDVGFKNVAPVMLREKALIGGEESGGYGFRGHVAERDGILANLYFLDLMVKTGKTPSQLLAYLYEKVGPHYYERVDVYFPEEARQAVINRIKENLPKAIDGVKVVRLDTADGFRFILVDNSWLLIRFSGTEPVLRIYSEAGSTVRARDMLDFGRKLAGV
ncbi:MAG: phosphoglucomutase/phosphomannomutase family protein [Dehalococcoidales bacterium]|nr:phosphoglucomutase/phosphomannomutase family protein [Dehalococcoidales bacterium]